MEWESTTILCLQLIRRERKVSVTNNSTSSSTGSSRVLK